VFARTKRLEDIAGLQRAGATEVVAEELEAAEEIIIRLLKFLGMPRGEAFQRISAVDAEKERRAEEESLIGLA
jgi:voltage-gated potassium channel Kch